MTMSTACHKNTVPNIIYVMHCIVYDTLERGYFANETRFSHHNALEITPVWYNRIGRV